MDQNTKDWLAKIATGLDLDFDEERATFRQRVKYETHVMKLAALNRLIGKPQRSNELAARTLADEYLSNLST
jgi:hypothetical protein